MQTYLDFNQYIRQGEPAQKDRAEAWRVAIGLQAVDGLKTSEYLQQTARRNIEGDITIDEARELLKQYYISKTTHNSGDADNEEADKVSVNITKILSSGTFDFSANGIISLHRRIFDGVFKHAGRIRDYDISKKEWVLEGASVSHLNWEDLLRALEYDIELEGSVIGQLQDAVAFIRNNSHKRWWKESDHREELPDYPERAVTEVICNAIIHRDYQELGSEIHIDMYNDRMEVYSPGGMIDGRLIQQLNPLSVPSKRRNPLLADFFGRLNLMEHRGSGMKKILGEYNRFESLKEYRAPEFNSNATEFHVTLWNLNYGTDVVKDVANYTSDVTKEFVKEFVKEPVRFTKEFVKAQRRIYKLISTNPQINIAAIAENLGVSTRQVQKYLRRLTELQLIAREGGRKNGFWKILDKDYDDFFERI